MSSRYPLMLDVSDRLIVIVGGGAVAARKISGLIKAGATRLRIVAPTCKRTFPESVECVNERYRAEHLDGAALVFAATDCEETNSQIVNDARSRGILVNRADASEHAGGDFITPAIYRDGPVMLAVSAGSAALSVTIRDSLMKNWNEAWTRLASELTTLRPLVTLPIDESPVEPELRRAALQSLGSAEAIDILSARGSEGLRDWLIEQHPQLRPYLENQPHEIAH